MKADDHRAGESVEVFRRDRLIEWVESFGGFHPVVERGVKIPELV